MELRIFFPLLSMLSSGIFRTAIPASLGESAEGSISARNSRTKRCSCATFLDKECVYFCHLDIIWVNTPERTVSYGLGSAPRKKRSVEEVSRATVILRCKCTDSNDRTCSLFCRTDKETRHKAARENVIRSASGADCAEKQGKYNLAAKTWRIKRAPNRGDPLVTSGPAASSLQPHKT